MNIKRIIREEINSDGLQWINDIKSNKDIAEELFNQTVITKDKGIVKLPFSWAHHQSKKPYFDLSIKKKYGEDKDSDDIWERYKVLVNNRLKELTDKSIKESNDLQWISDVKSDEDVAQEIIDKTEIVKDTDGNIRIKSDFVSHTIEGEDFYYDSATYFIEHLENYYGIEDLNHVSRIWKRYKKGMATKIDKELGIVNESNDFSWIDEIPKWDFYNGSYYIDISELDEDEACEVQQLILDMDINWQDSKGLQTGHCNTFINKGYIIRNATLYRTTKNWDDYMKLLGRTKSRFNDYGSITYIDGRTELLS